MATIQAISALQIGGKSVKVAGLVVTGFSLIK